MKAQHKQEFARGSLWDAFMSKTEGNTTKRLVKQSPQREYEAQNSWRCTTPNFNETQKVTTLKKRERVPLLNLTMKQSISDASLRPMQKAVGESKAPVMLGDTARYANATSRNNPLCHPHQCYSHRGRVAATPDGAPDKEKPIRKNSRNNVLYKQSTISTLPGGSRSTSELRNVSKKMVTPAKPKIQICKKRFIPNNNTTNYNKQQSYQSSGRKKPVLISNKDQGRGSTIYQSHGNVRSQALAKSRSMTSINQFASNIDIKQLDQ